MNHVTFETAKRLEAAGFPQPKLNHLQLWTARRYPDGTARHDALLIVNTKNTLIPFDGGNHVDCDEKRRAFMPTATDILPLLGANWNLSSYKMPSGLVQFACIWNYEEGESADPGREFYSTSPAEAAAMAWLQIHEKK